MSARDPEQPARQRRRSEETRPDRIAALIRDVRAELDQTPEWWDRQYRQTVGEHYSRPPFNPAHHDDHDVQTLDTIASTYVLMWCLDCPPPPLVPKITLEQEGQDPG